MPGRALPHAKQFGSRYPATPRDIRVFDFLLEEQLGTVVSLADSCGMLVFDPWPGNTNRRQAALIAAGRRIELPGADG